MVDTKFVETLAELLSSNYDKKPTKNEEYAKQLVSVHEEFVKRNEKLTSLLDDFITQRKERVRVNNFLKKFIFWFFIGMLAVLTITVVGFVAFNITIKTIPSMVSLISVSATYLASLIGIFKIMSKYLFPVDEEKDTISMIKAVINNDVKVEQLMSNAIDKNLANDVEQLKLMNELLRDGIITQEEFDDIKKIILNKIKCSQ